MAIGLGGAWFGLVPRIDETRAAGATISGWLVGESDESRSHCRALLRSGQRDAGGGPGQGRV